MEIWKDVMGYDGHYQVSSLGNIRSTYYQNKSCRIYKFKERKLGAGRGDYLDIAFVKNGKVKNNSVHRIVALAFIDNPLNKSQVNHINGIKTDNSVENLEWCTPQENATHASKNGLLRFGGRHHCSKLTKQDVLDIRKLNKFLSQRELAKMFNVVQSTIGAVLLGKTWKHI